MSSQSIHLRLPRRLYGRLKDVADEEGVSLNTLMTALLAGSTGFTLDPEAPPASEVVSTTKGASLMADSRDRDSKPSGYYKVDRQLREAFPIALKPQPSGLSARRAPLFREKPSGDLWVVSRSWTTRTATSSSRCTRRPERPEVGSASSQHWLRRCTRGTDEAARRMTVALCTSYYAGYRPEYGVAVRTSVGSPRSWEGDLEHIRRISPYGVFGEAEGAEYERRYIDDSTRSTWSRSPSGSRRSAPATTAGRWCSCASRGTRPTATARCWLGGSKPAASARSRRLGNPMSRRWDR